MLRRRQAAELSYFPVHRHDRLEVVLLGDRDVDYITAVMPEVLRRADDLAGNLWIRGDSLFEQRARARAVSQLVPAHITEQLRQHWLTSLLGQSPEKVRGKKLGAHEVRQVGDDLVAIIGDAARFLTRSDKRSLGDLGSLVANYLEIPSQRRVMLETLVELEAQD